MLFITPPFYPNRGVEGRGKGRDFLSIADAAEHFFNDRDRRSPIKYALAKHTKFLDKYYLVPAKPKDSISTNIK